MSVICVNLHRHLWRNLRTIVKAGTKGPLIVEVCNLRAIEKKRTAARVPWLYFLSL
jgi:hypothetical protein